MEQKSKQTVPFDPGFYKYNPQVDTQALLKLEEVTKVKAFNQRKSIIIQSEDRIIKTFNLLAAIYYGCVLYGSIISAKHRQSPMGIDNNPFEYEEFKEQDQQSIFSEAEYVIQYSLKLENAVQFYLKRKSKLIPNIITYIELYLDFARLNEGFMSITSTDQIKLPVKMQYFYDFKQETLIEKEETLFKIINSGSLDNIFNIS